MKKYVLTIVMKQNINLEKMGRYKENLLSKSEKSNREDTQPMKRKIESVIDLLNDFKILFTLSNNLS